MQQFFPLSLQALVRLTQKFTAGVLLAGLWCNPILSQSVIERASIYKIRNQVDLSRQNQQNWLKANVGDTIVPQDAVRTGANSRADLLFNEGTLVRTGGGTTFRFPPGRRNFELTSGAALIMIRPDRGQSTITTPQATVVSQGTALFMQHDPQSNASLIGVLTESPAGLVKVSTANGDVSIQLQAGQFVSIVQGVVGLVEYFVLPMFYETIELAAGIGMGQESAIAQELPEVQATIRAVQAEAIEPLKNQLAWLNGFCRIGIEAEGISSALQLLGMGVPGGRVKFELPQNDLFVIPFRSIGGITWLNNYCQANQTPPNSAP
ncbi:MAG: FecR domain-containing protein [Pleurocapsa sp.]